MTTSQIGPLRYSPVDVNAVFEPVQPLLVRMMMNHADPSKIAEVLAVVAEELQDRHQRRLRAMQEYADRARVAAENRPTLHRVLVTPATEEETDESDRRLFGSVETPKQKARRRGEFTRDASQEAPAPGAAPQPPASS